MPRTCTVRLLDEVNVQLIGIDDVTLKKAAATVTFTVKNSQFMKQRRAGFWNGKKSLVDRRDGSTFRHMLHKILPPIASAGYEIVIEDNRVPNSIAVPEIENNLFEGYEFKRFKGIMEPHQVDAINAATSCGGGLVLLPTGAGKAQPLRSKVLTPSGWRDMGDLQAGDAVIAGTGEISKITGVYPQGVKKIYRVYFNDGRTADCCDEHLWKVYNVFWPDDRYRVLPLMQIKKELDRRTSKGYFIDLFTPAIDRDIRLPLDPYLLGVLIGDGGLRHSVILSSADDFIVSKVKAILGVDYAVSPIEGSCCDYRITYPKDHKKNPLMDCLRELGVHGKYSYEKVIPEQYMSASTDQRFEVIRGLMDTDGECNSNLSFSTTSKVLAEQMVELVRSVGGICKMPNPRRTCYTHNGEKRTGRESYRISIRHNSPELFFSLPRKLASINPSYQYRGQWKLKIEKIEEIGEESCQCISIDHPCRLYVTDNYVITHNTVVTAGFAQLYYQFGRSLIVVPRKDLVLETQETIQALGMPDCGCYFDEYKHPEYITVTTWQSLQIVPQLFQDVNMVLVDECHGADAKVLFKLLTEAGRNVPIRIGMTGTLPSDDLSKHNIMSALGPVVFVKKAKELQDIGFLATCKIFILKYHDRQRPEYQSVMREHELYIDESRWQFRHPERLYHVSSFIDTIKAEGNTLVLVRNREYGEALQKRIPGSIYLNGDAKARVRHQVYREFNAGNNGVLICTYGIASTGIDIARLFNLCLIEPGKEAVPIVQSIGRGLRKADDKKSVIIYHLGSDSKFSVKHLREVQEIYNANEYPYEMIEVEY